MNEEKMKSAVELALERTERMGRQARAEQVPLTEEMKKEIADLEKEYEARKAEKDIMLQAELKKLYQLHHPVEAEQMAAQVKAKFDEDKKTLQEEKKNKIEAIKDRARN